MVAIIFKRDDGEYAWLEAVLEAEAGLIDIDRAPLNGHKRYDHEYDVVIVAIEGAEGMEVVLEYSQRFEETQIIWVTSDSYFAGMAMRNHIYDFIVRPYEPERIQTSIRDVLPRCVNRNRFIMIPKRERKSAE